MASFKDNKCYSFEKLIAASRKDDVGKREVIATVKDLTFEAEYDRGNGVWQYELVWHPAGPVERYKLTPFSFKQLCTKFHCPANFMLKLPGNIAKQNIDFFKLDAKEDDLLLKVEHRPAEVDGRGNASEPFDYVRGMIKPSNPVLSNTTLLQSIQDPVAEYDMKVWKAHFRDHDFHAKLIYGEEINVGTAQSPDNVNVGVHISNSEVGARPLEINVMVFRLVCTNGLIHMIDGVPLYKKTAFNVSREEVTAEVRNAFHKIENHKERIIATFQDAASVSVKSPYQVISAIDKEYNLSKAVVVAVTEEFNRGKAMGEYVNNKIGIINAITRTAQAYDQEDRVRLETIAGQFLVNKEIIKKLENLKVD